MSYERHQLTIIDLVQALADVDKKLKYRADQKGLGIMVSSHEILGIIEEEVHEYKMAVHRNHADLEKVEELKDIAVACIFGIASINSDEIDW